MKKCRRSINAVSQSHCLLKILRIMKLSMIMFLFASLQIFAGGVYSQDTELTLSLGETNVGQALTEIENQSEFYFLFNQKLVNTERKVFLQVSNKKIGEILDQIFTGTNTDYYVTDRQIVLAPKEYLSEIKTAIKVETAQQQKIITGIVNGPDGKPLPGVTVSIKGSSLGTITNAEGKYFLLEVPDDAEILVISYIGMITQEIAIGSQTTINVTMVVDEFGIDEVVVVGFGTQKKTNLTGSVAQFDSKVLKGRPITSASQALQGTAAGVYVTQSYGAPGRDDARIRIRGLSLQLAGGTNEPLILIDGVQGSLNNLNPTDIETVSVLKDAASTAIYGSQAANGVVLVTTKRGQIGRLSVEYEGFGGFQRATALPDMVSNSVQFMETVNGAYIAGGRNAIYPDETIEAYKNNPDLPNTNWFDLVYRDAPIQQHNFKISGGNESTRYYFSAGYLNQEGIQINTASDRVNVRLNLDTKIGDRFRAGVNISASDQNRNDQGGGLTSIFLQSMAANPVAAHMVSGDGRYSNPKLGINGGERSNRNPMGDIENEFYFLKAKNLNMALFGELEIIDGLSVKGQFAYRLNNNSYKTFIKGWGTFTQNTVTDPVTGGQVFDINVPDNTSTGFPIGTQNGGVNTLSRSLTETEYYNMFSHLNYQKQFGEHEIVALAGVQQEWITGYSFGATIRNGYPDPIEEFTAGSADPLDQTVSRAGVPSEWILRSGFSRLNYSFMDRYLFEANVRADASSRFHPDNRTGYFPSFSAGWRISEEEFLQSVDFLSNLKLRASWGQSGEQRGSNAYSYISTIGSNGGYVFGSGTALTTGKSINTLSDENIQWQTNQQLDVGVEAGFFGGKLTVEAEYFIKDNRDQLARLQMVALAGIGAPIGNPFSVRNKGWEFNLGHKNRINDLSYQVNVNLTSVMNVVTDLAGDSIIGARNITAEGLGVNTLYLYQWEGIVQTQEEADALNAGAPDGTYQLGGKALLKPGDLIYKDLNGDGHITAEDKAPTGKPYPGLTFGMNFSVQYKGFDFGMLAQGIYDYDIFMLGWGFDVLQQNSLTTMWLDGWTEDNPSTTIPIVRTPLGGANNNNRPGAMPSTWYVHNGSYLRFKNIQLGYTFPVSLSRMVYVESLRVFVNAQNAFTISDFPEGFDPERLTITDPSGATPRAAMYPQMKAFTVGLNVKF